ncbi:MAG TPA: MurR/RpiR family transcriptional regulator [Steroidobacteraceae bacterium]|nr:MurR/RpiR family transcriptional regulator [Steroidobacteraceae bacterium]
MSSLVKIRAERDQMSAIERRIADFILENAHLLRDYSSQQLANSLGISQSSVVKFSQKLGFKGYPDLKVSVSEAVARENGNGETRAVAPSRGDPQAALASDLWRSKTLAEEETRLINTPVKITEIARAIDAAEKVFVIGLGEDGVPARAFAMKLALLGVPVICHTDPVLMSPALGVAGKGDVLVLFSEHGRQPALGQVGRQFHERRGKVVSVTRHSANPLRAHADMSLLVSAHDERTHIQPLLYQAVLQHVLDLVFLMLCEVSEDRVEQLHANLKRAQRIHEP